MKKVFLVLLLLAAGGGAWWLARGRRAQVPAEARTRTTAVVRGEVIEGVAASGAIQPFVLVQVGTQVSGVVERLFKDFNDHVEAGETIALIDSRRYAAQVAQDEASLARARADRERVAALIWQAERDLERQETLARQKLIADVELDAAVAGTRSLRAQGAVAETVVRQAQAQLDGDLVNLHYCTIASPTGGVVVSRSVDVGQTVAASLAAPTLFVIANDLTKIQVQASVPEADIGRIHRGQRATFGVDAHPDRVFRGAVSQVRLAASTVQSVVTYTVLIDAENPDLLLMPGMTANATFEIARSAVDALLVPASALRLDPPAALIEAAAATPEAEAAPAAHGSDDARPHAGRKGDRTKARPSRVYVRTEKGLLRAVRVRAGTTDGVRVAVEPLHKGDLEEGAPVVTAILEDDDAPPTTNPFAPTGMGGPRRGPH